MAAQRLHASAGDNGVELTIGSVQHEVLVLTESAFGHDGVVSGTHAP